MADIEEHEVPGTTRIIQSSGDLVGADTITLVPTPSSDPEDPLNWSSARKALNLACVISYTATASLVGSVLYSIYTPLSASTGLSLDQLNAGAGYSYLFIGLGLLLSQPAALAFGKRPVYLISTIAYAASNIWTMFLTGNGQWIARCVILGLLSAPNFGLIEVSIADLYFYHERALPMGIYVCLLYAAACLGPVFGGYIFEGLGWKACIYLSSALGALVFILLFLFLEETNYQRDESPVPIDAPLQPIAGSLSDSKDGSDSKVDGVDVDIQVTAPVDVNARLSTPWHGPRPLKFSKPSPFAAGIMWRGLSQTLALFAQPIVLWCGVMYGVYQVYYNLIAALTSGILSYPPYNFSTGSVGLTFLSPMLGSIPGAMLGGWVTDLFTVSQARKNYGISEAEHKLKLFIWPTILTPIGLLMIGLGPYYGAHWIVFVIGAFILNLAGPLATLLILTYAFDTYHSIQPRDRTGVHSVFQSCAPYILAIMVIAMVVTFGFNYVITPWAFTWGLFNFAISSACISVALNLTVLAILKWGKSLRKRGIGYYERVINW